MTVDAEWKEFFSVLRVFRMLKLCNRPIMHAPMNKYNLLRRDNLLLMYLTHNHTHGI